MLSLNFQCALEREIVGQSRAVRTLVRALIVARSGLGAPGAPVGAYLLLGPSGTGKTHFARTLARLLHGDARRLVVVDCDRAAREDRPDLMGQVAARLHMLLEGGAAGRPPAPHTILLFEHLESATPDLVRALVAALEVAQVVLPDGNVVSLEGCLILLTSKLCSREIYGEDRQVGFSSASEDLEESEKARIFQVCSAAAQRCWGGDLLARLDDLIVFHRLQERHLPFILGRLVRELNTQLAPRGVSLSLEPAAASFLIGKAGHFLQHGAWFLDKVFRRFVRFPLADLLMSSPLAGGGSVRVDHEGGDSLRFEAAAGDALRSAPDAASFCGTVPIVWDDDPVSTPGAR